MRFETLPIRLIVMGLLILSSSCSRRHHHSSLNLEGMPQIRSLSLFGSRQASLVVGTVGNPRELRLTTDGGQTWQVIRSQATGGAFESATMTDGNRGWAVSRQGQVFSTNSAGMSWTLIADVAAASSGDFVGGKQIEFANETDGWILEGLSIWRTKDGGVTWRKTVSVSTPGVKGQPTSIHAIDAKTLVVSATEGQSYVTRDGGDSWKVETLVSDGDFTDIWFADQQKGWVSGYVGASGNRPLLFMTKDGGASWEEIHLADNEIMPRSICFLGEEGWLAGDRRVNSGPFVALEGVLLHTKDGGMHWTPVQLDSDDPFFNLVRFADKQHGWVAGRDNLYRTEDGGNTWRAILKLPPIKDGN